MIEIIEKKTVVDAMHAGIFVPPGPYHLREI